MFNVSNPINPNKGMCRKQDGEWFDGCLYSYTMHFYLGEYPI